MIEIENLSKRYQMSAGRTHLALSDIDLHIRSGEFVSIIGPSGCGKSTLLYIVGGFIPASAGKIRVDGKDVAGPGPDRGPVFQEFALFAWKTVLANITYGLRLQGRSRAEAESHARKLLKMMGMEKFENFYPKELSGGMKQRVAIARTLAYDPDILLMDEPFGALDAHVRTHLQRDLLRIWEQHRKTVLFVTHSVEEAVYLSDRVIVMAAAPGRVVQDITIELDRPRARGELMFNRHYQEYVSRIEGMIDAFESATP